jgi:CRISPR/Cas system-associated endoribonuclease Cas2
MRPTLFLVFCFFFSMTSFAQKNIRYDVERGIDLIESQYINAWKKIKKTEGFRIQITSFAGTNSRTSIEKIAEQFSQQFPEIPFYISYSEPNFRLRVGNFCTKLEAYKALQAIAPLFPGAFVLKDQIDFK